MLAFGCQRQPAAFGTGILEVAADRLTFGYDEVGTARSVAVRSSGAYSYSVAYADGGGWLSVEQADDAISVSVTEVNDSDADRRATIRLSADNAIPQAVTVTQLGLGSRGDYSISLSEPSLRFPACGEHLSQRVSITTEGTGLQAVTEEQQEWYVAYIEDSELVVAVLSNASTAERTGMVVVTNEQGAYATLEICQDAGSGEYSITLAPSSIEFAAMGEELTGTVSVVTAGTGVSATVPVACAGWLSAEMTGDELSVTVTPNGATARSGLVKVSNREGASASLEVHQMGTADMYVSVEPSVLEFGTAGGSGSGRVVTNGTGLEIEVATDAEGWLSAILEGDELRVSVAPMAGSGRRTGVVSVSVDEGAHGTLTVIQSGAEVGDISGIWNWSSVSTTSGDWSMAERVSGRAEISYAGGIYVVKGIAGNVASALGVAGPKMYLAMHDGQLGVACGEAFSVGETDYYSAAVVSFPSGIIEPWQTDGRFTVATVENVVMDGVEYERILFPVELLADSTSFPDYDVVWGEMGVLGYCYCRRVMLGGVELLEPVEYHRDIVLMRPVG